MTNCEPGDVVLVRFPFTDFSASKKRPALVLSPAEFCKRYGDAVILALTSQPQPETEFQLQSWRAAGLPKATWLKPIIATLATSMVDRRLGKLATEDLARVQAVIPRLIWPSFLSHRT